MDNSSKQPPNGKARTAADSKPKRYRTLKPQTKAAKSHTGQQIEHHPPGKVVMEEMAFKSWGEERKERGRRRDKG